MIFSKNLKKKNITPDKFIDLVDTIYSKFVANYSGRRGNYAIVCNLCTRFEKLKNEVRESVESNKFNKDEFIEKMPKILSDISKQIKTEQEERKRKEQEENDRERKKQEEKEREQQELLEKYDNETREKFIKRFKNNIYNSTDPYEDDFMRQHSDVAWGGSTDVHDDIKNVITHYAGTDSNKKNFAKSVYAELMWLNYKYFIKKLKDNGYGASFHDNYNDNITRMMGIMLPAHNEGKQNYRACTTYEEFLNVIKYYDYDYGFCFMKFYKDIDYKLGCEFHSIVRMLCYVLERLKTTNSNYKYKRALETLDVIGEKLDNLEKMDDPSTGVIAKAIQENLLQPIVGIVNSKSKEIKAKSSNKKQRVFDQNKRYDPYDKKAGRGGYGTVKIYRDTENERKVAIKTFRSGEPLDNEKLKNLQKIDSNYVVKLYELTTLENGKNGLVMEYVPGHESFSKAVFNTKRFSRVNVLNICHQLVNAFRAFAKAGFAHNDVNNHTENIVIDKYNNIKVIDYETVRHYGVSDENANENIKITLRCIVTALYNSYPDLYKKFTKKFAASLLSITPNVINKFASVTFGKKLPSFNDITKALDELSAELKNQ